jgi:hypothetical protein
MLGRKQPVSKGAASLCGVATAINFSEVMAIITKWEQAYRKGVSYIALVNVCERLKLLG